MPRYGMVIDLDRCIGCDACTIACKEENATPPGIIWNQVPRKEVGQYPLAREVFVPFHCLHCEDPPCLKACPNKAIGKRDDGIVLIDKEKCCGSKACIAACPYDAITFLEHKRTYFENYTTPFEEIGYQRHEEMTATKCTFCYHRVDKGLEPACAQTCLAKCITFGDLDDPKSNISQKMQNTFQLHPEYKTNPSVYYKGPK